MSDEPRTIDISENVKSKRMFTAPEWLANFAVAMFQHMFVKIITFPAVATLLTIIFLATLMGIVRRRGLDPSTSVSELETYPMVSLITCCKGRHNDSLSNFKRNLALEYPGDVEFIFVVESQTDPAYACIQQAIEEVPFTRENRKVKIVVAGLSFHNAQKTHNILYGVASVSPESEYALFVDDDVFFYPGLIEELVDPLIKEPEKVLISTGYEFISLPKGASIADYCYFTFRMHNLWSFITPRPILAWGGCLMCPLWVFRKNFAKIVDCYIDGGYSDDDIISCVVQEHKYVCAHPYRAIFPSVIPADTTFSKYWEYICRQIFVTFTYTTGYEKRTGYTLRALILGAMYLVMIWVLLSPWAGAFALLSSITVPNWEWNFFSRTAVVTIFLWVVVAISWKWGLKVMTDVTNSVRTPDQQVSPHFNPFKMYLGIFLHCMTLPMSILRGALEPNIVWSGIKYHIEDGKIHKVERQDADGNFTITDLPSISIARTLADPRIKEMLAGTFQQDFKETNI